MDRLSIAVGLALLTNRASKAGDLFPEQSLAFAYPAATPGEATNQEVARYYSALQKVQLLEIQAQAQREAGDVPEA